MNTLSWIIYAAEVSDSLILVSSGSALLLISLAAIVGICVTVEDCWEKVKPYYIAGLKWVIVLAIVSILTPSSRTLYLIAASEIGEEVITSERGQKIIEILDQKINELAGTDQ